MISFLFHALASVLLLSQSYPGWIFQPAPSNVNYKERFIMICIDGSFGEGGGQILRSSLALSMVTGKVFRIEKIRSRRRKPGLLRQHLTAVKAAAEISSASVNGADPGSLSLEFSPGSIKSGEYHFAVGTAGSGTLVLQTVLPALIKAGGTSTLIIEGGTHNPAAPPFDFLKKVFLPFLGRMGCRVEAELVRYGFYPAGGGIFKVTVEAPEHLARLELMERGDIKVRSVRGIVSQVPRAIAGKEAALVIEALSWASETAAVESVDSPGPGNAVMIGIESENVSELFTGFGEKNVSVDAVVHKVLPEVKAYLATGVPVGIHLADQLLLPMAIGGGGKFRTLAPSCHTLTNIEVIKKFLDVDIRCEKVSGDVWEIEVNV